MIFQFIRDNKGNTTGVYIPIEEWQWLKTKYKELQKVEVEENIELLPWQKHIIEDRLAGYNINNLDVLDFDKTLDDIEKEL